MSWIQIIKHDMWIPTPAWSKSCAQLTRKTCWYSFWCAYYLGTFLEVLPWTRLKHLVISEFLIAFMAKPFLVQMSLLLIDIWCGQLIEYVELYRDYCYSHRFVKCCWVKSICITTYLFITFAEQHGICLFDAETMLYWTQMIIIYRACNNKIHISQSRFQAICNRTPGWYCPFPEAKWPTKMTMQAGNSHW